MDASRPIDSRQPTDLAPLLRQNPLATLDAIRRLDLHLADCDGAVARGIVGRALRHLEADLLVQLTGPKGDGRRGRT